MHVSKSNFGTINFVFVKNNEGAGGAGQTARHHDYLFAMKQLTILASDRTKQVKLNVFAGICV